MRIFLCCLSILALVSTGSASEFESKDERAFAEGLKKYIELQQYLEPSVAAQKSTNESGEITDRQQQLAGLIANARRDARQGDIFTHDVADEFHKVIRKAFKEPGGREMRRTIRERDPIKRIVLRVNEMYPDDLVRTTMPPTLLDRLPTLPKELAYRIIGRALILQDTRTNLIVDFIPNAIP